MGKYVAVILVILVSPVIMIYAVVFTPLESGTAHVYLPTGPVASRLRESRTCS